MIQFMHKITIITLLLATISPIYAASTLSKLEEKIERLEERLKKIEDAQKKPARKPSCTKECACGPDCKCGPCACK